MIELHIPGRGEIQLDHPVCDANGTPALDGRLLDPAALGIARLPPEALATAAPAAADALTPDMAGALALLEHPLRQ
jgi:hypothetical protein